MLNAYLSLCSEYRRNARRLRSQLRQSINSASLLNTFVSMRCWSTSVRAHLDAFTSKYYSQLYFASVFELGNYGDGNNRDF